MLSAAAAEGRRISVLEAVLDRLAGWLSSGGEAESLAPTVGQGDDVAFDRLFRHLVPDVTGRRTGGEIVERLRRKWDLDRSLSHIFDVVRRRVHALSELVGPAATVLEQLEGDLAVVAPASASDLCALVAQLEAEGVEPGRIELDLGFGRGIGFYSQMIFELYVPAPAGPYEVCGGGRYDGLAHVLGSDRDDRGAGFAFGLERLADACASSESDSSP